MPSWSATHAVTNQPPPFEDVNLFSTDAALQDAVRREGGAEATRHLVAFGLTCGRAEAFDRGRLADQHPPRLRTHDGQGRRLDVVEYHPAYHAAMETSFAAGLHCAPWLHLAPGAAATTAGAHVIRAAGLYMATQMEAGHCGPVSLTHAAVPALLLTPEVGRPWLAGLLGRSYDPAFRPAGEKASVTIGMGLTEKQGGTDLRAGTTEAVAQGSRGPGAAYRLTGHKWFLSAPMSDAFLVLAQAAGGLSCFLVPRFLPDGHVNALHIQRLKDKLGNRSNATGEVEFAAAHGWLLGEEGRGVAAITESVTFARLDCAVSSAGLMRLALAHAVHHAEHRCAFERPLIEQPLMRQVLADLALDVEAATALVFRLARSFDLAGDVRASAWRRLMTPVTKYWVCKMAPALVAEAMECLGGNGYVEDSPLARLYREVPVNALWEGPGNVLALDVLRVLQREPEVAGIVMEEIGQAVAGDAALEAAQARVERLLYEPRWLDVRARELVEGLATLAAAAILRGHGPAAVADAFVATRLGGAPRKTYGQGLEWADVAAILERASAHA